MAGGYLVTQVFENIDARPDENDARFLASSRELRVLGQETVTGMDGIDLMGDR